MANLHHKGSKKGLVQTDPQQILAAVQSFLATCHTAAILEHGEETVLLNKNEFGIEIRAGFVSVEFSSGNHTVSRRIISIERHATGLLECVIQRFAGKEGHLSFLDLHRPQTANKLLRGSRESFSEQFRRMLYRQFPGWEITNLSCGMDLQRSLSPVFPRAFLRRGTQQIAAMACPQTREENALLTFALIWHDHLTKSSNAGTTTQLCLFLPDSAGCVTAQRLRWLTRKPLNARLFRFNLHGSAGEVDPQDLGNLDTHVSLTPPHYTTAYKRSSPPNGERVLEQKIRRAVQNIDASLCPEPVHGQVLTLAAMDRDLIDLLAVSVTGRLTVMELKVVEDIHLPMQALDYWMRIAWHAERGELTHLFPGVSLAKKQPRLLLIAPAMSFHSKNATVLSYFSTSIEIERIGINKGWDHITQVVMRLSGADLPISHRSLE